MPDIMIAAPAAGRLLGWAIAGVQLVTGGELLGEIEAPDGTRYPLRAPGEGEAWRRAKRGDLVEEGTPVAGFTARTPSEALQQPLAPAPAAPRSTPAPAPARATAAPTAPRSVPIVEELKLEPPPPPSAPARTPRPRTKHATYHLTDNQQERLKRLVLELKLEGGELATMSESEALRAAVEMLLALPGPALAATLRENRARERAGKYGVGWPRPTQKGKGR